MIKIASWNINSVRIRIDLLQTLVEKHHPDIICLQETKVEDHLFPRSEIEKLGFEFIEFSGQKSYNGVAILSKIPITRIQKIDILDYGQARHISAIFEDNIHLHNFYVPAGGEEPDPEINHKFDHKLKFLDWMIDLFKTKYDQNSKVIMLGDMNIAPLEHDVWSHKALLKIISHTPIEVEKMRKLQKTLDWVDCFRNEANKMEKIYSWWSYRAKQPLVTNKGRRLDHIWTTPMLKNRLKSTKIITKFRIEKKPSDHVPIMIEI